MIGAVNNVVIQPLAKILPAVGRIYPRQFYLGHALTTFYCKVNVRIISCRLHWVFQTKLCIGFLCRWMCPACFVHLNASFNLLQLGLLEKHVFPQRHKKLKKSLYLHEAVSKIFRTGAEK
jgi:hypothetical protein